MKRNRIGPYTVIVPDALRVPENVPLTLGIGGDVIGSISDVSFEDGDISITARVNDPYVSEKLFGAYSAGGFSLAAPTPQLCTPCGFDKCDTLVDHDKNCMCCRDGHVV